jgi:hypothetical protein
MDTHANPGIVVERMLPGCPQAQTIMGELFSCNQLALCGPISKMKLTVMELAAIHHLINHFLQVSKVNLLGVLVVCCYVVLVQL